MLCFRDIQTLAGYRETRGSKHHASKLTEEDVVLLRELYAENIRLRKELESLSVPALMEKFGVSRTTIIDAISGRTWTHVPMPPGLEKLQ